MRLTLAYKAQSSFGTLRKGWSGSSVRALRQVPEDALRSLIEETDDVEARALALAESRGPIVQRRLRSCLPSRFPRRSRTKIQWWLASECARDF